MKFTFLLASLLLTFGGGSDSSGELGRYHAKFANNPVVAHRGGHRDGVIPENSIASLREAIRLGVAATETDIWMTQDGVLVLNHDPDYQGIPIERSTYKTLSEVKLDNGEALPTLEDYVSTAMEGQSGTRLFLEIKPSAGGATRTKLITAKTMAIVAAHGAQNLAQYISFDYDVLQAVLAIDSRARTFYLGGDKSPAQLKKDGVAGLNYNIGVYRNHPDWVADAHALSLWAGVWTVNRVADVEWCLHRNMDFVTTDQPALLLSLPVKI